MILNKPALSSLLPFLFGVVGIFLCFGERNLKAEELAPPAHPKFSLSDKNEAINRNPYDVAVEKYLEGDYNQALAQLKRHLQSSPGEQRSLRLFLKILQKYVPDLTERNETSQAEILVAEARRIFPGVPEWEELARTIKKTTSPPPTTPKTKPTSPNPLPEKKGLTMTTSASTSQGPSEKKGTLNSNKLEPLKEESKTSPKTNQRTSRWNSKDLVALGFGFFSFMTTLLILGFVLQTKKDAEKTTRNLTTGQDNLDRDKTALRKEIQDQFGKWEGALSTFEKELGTKLQNMLLKNRQEFEDRVRLLGAEQSRTLSNILHSLATTKSPDVGAQIPVGFPRPSHPPSPLPETSKQNLIKIQEDEIRGIIVEMPSFEKQQTWERIANKITHLFEDAPEETMEFLKNMAGQNDPTTKISLVGALEKIGSPQTVEMLFDFLSAEHSELTREVLKSFKNLLKGGAGKLPETYMKRIHETLQKEVSKAEWII